MSLLEQILGSAKKTSDLRASLEPHRENLVRYLAAVYGAEPSSARICACPKGGPTPAAQHLPLSLGFDAIKTAILDMAIKTDVYVTLAPNRANANVAGARHGTLAEKEFIRCTWLDIDIGDASKKRPSEGDHPPFFTSKEEAIRFLIERSPLEPSMIVDSGGGLHVYWIFDKRSEDIAGVQALVSAMQRDFQRRARALPEPRFGPDLVPAPTQILRPPGSINYKRGETEIVRLLHLSDKRYSLEELRAVWPTSAGAKKVFAPTMPLDRELSREETLSLMRGSILRAHGWEFQQNALKFLAGESWAPPGSQDIVLTRIAWRLSMACRWRPSTEAVEELCDAAADAVENTGEPWTSDQILQRFESAIGRGLAAAEKDAALLKFLKQHNRPN